MSLAVSRDEAELQAQLGPWQGSLASLTSTPLPLLRRPITLGIEISSTAQKGITYAEVADFLVCDITMSQDSTIQTGSLLYSLIWRVHDLVHLS